MSGEPGTEKFEFNMIEEFNSDETLFFIKKKVNIILSYKNKISKSIDATTNNCIIFDLIIRERERFDI